MHVKSILTASISTLVITTLAYPAPEFSTSSIHGIIVPQSASGTGQANIGATLGGGILPTYTIGGFLIGEEPELAAGFSNSVAWGGRLLPSFLAGHGVAASVDPNNLLGQASATASRAGWLGGLVPMIDGGWVFNGNAGYNVENGVAAILGMNSGGWRTLGYGGIFLPTSRLIANGGGQWNFSIKNGAAQEPTPTPTPNP